jgi:hypothetical protein
VLVTEYDFLLLVICGSYLFLRVIKNECCYSGGVVVFFDLFVSVFVVLFFVCLCMCWEKIYMSFLLVQIY